MTNKRIAVLMTCYNRVDTTLECLRLLFAQKMPEGHSFDVWLVDDASPDGTGEKVKAAYPQTNIIHGTGKLFWCKGMRLAWDKAAAAQDYDYYLWLNDDAMLVEDALASLVSDCEKTQSVVVGTFASDKRFSEVSYGATKRLPTGQPIIAEKPMNGNLVLVPKDVFRKVGPICGRYHHQYGDYDYGKTLQRKGLVFYASSRFSGICPQQPQRYLHLQGLGIWKRLALLGNPKGYDLHDAFLFSLRNKGLWHSFATVIHVMVKVVFGISK